MSNKSKTTTAYILKVTAPIFNKKGYNGTSMSDITNATGLTKGAIYGNFKNKDELSILAFNYNVKNTIDKLSDELSHINSAIAKLYCLTSFFRKYHKLTNDYGGCPIINIGIDSRFKNPKLLKRVKSIIKKLEKSIEDIIVTGIKNNEISKSVNASTYASLFFSMIEGSIFMSTTLNDSKYINIVTNQIDQIIRKELII